MFAEESGGFAILLQAGCFVKEKEVAARINVVNVVLVDLVCANGAVLVDEVVHAALNEVEVLFVVGGEVDAFDAFQHETVIVGPPRRVAGFVLRRVAPE